MDVRHHIQLGIIRYLAHRQSAAFSELKPEGIENKLFTYHLKQAMTDGLVYKSDKRYALTPTGKMLWKRIGDKRDHIARRAFSVIFVVVRNMNDQWLLYRRKTHPLLGRTGFLHCVPEWDKNTHQTVSDYIAKLLAVSCEPQVRASGYFRIHDSKGELESFSHFTLMETVVDTSTNPEPEDSAEYFWTTKDCILQEDSLPNMPSLLKALDSDANNVFIEEMLLDNHGE